MKTVFSIAALIALTTLGYGQTQDIKRSLPLDNLTVPGSVNAMTLLSSVNGVVNVKASPYNAVGDGVTDDTAALSNAFKNAVVYIPSGTYLSATLYPTNGYLFGDGPSSKLIFKNPATSTPFLDCKQNSVRLEKLWIDGNTNYNFNQLVVATYNSTGIVHYVTGDSWIRDCKVSRFAVGVYLDGPNFIFNRQGTAFYQNNFLTNSQVALYAGTNNAAEYVLVSNNQIRGNLNGFWNYTAANLTFIGNVITDCANIGVYANPSYRAHTLYSGNTVNHCSKAFYFIAVKSGMVVGNNILGNSTAFYLTSSTNVVVSNNLIEAGGATTVYLSGGATNVFHGNSFAGSAATIGGNTTNNFIPTGQNFDFNLGTLIWQ